MSFIDTNVLVHSTATGSPFHAQARAALGRIASEGLASISRQVLREYLSVTTRPQTWAKAFTLAEAIADAEAFARSFTILEDGPLVWKHLTALSGRFSFGGRQVHDANIVATMLAHGETRLLTFNGADFRRFNRLIDIVAA